MESRPERSHHRSASPFEAQIGFSRAVRHGSRILVSGTAPIGPDGECFEGGAYEQAMRCFAIASEAITALGGELADVVRTRMYLVDADDWREVGRAHGDTFRGIDPAATMVVVAGLLDPRWRVEIEVEAESGSVRSGVRR
jgi:enamine deaminase RidA (YjgF/YER057c/UK114 family)